MVTTNPKLTQLIDTEIDQKYQITFFEPFLINYIADFKPAAIAAMSDQEYDHYIHEKNTAATQEFCAQIRSKKTIEEAIKLAIQTLLEDFVK